MPYKRISLKLNALSNWIALGVNVAVGFFLTPAILAYLGEKRFGMWMLVNSVVGYFGLLRLGVGPGLFRYVPLFHGKGDQDRVGRVVSTGIAFHTGVGVLICIILFLSADAIADFFHGTRELVALIRLIGLAAAIECPALALDTTIRSCEGFVLANFVTILGAILRAGLLFGCIAMGYGLVPMGWAIVIVTFALLVGKGVAFRSFCKDVHFSTKRICLSDLKMLISFGVVISIASLGDVLTTQAPKQVIGKVMSLEALGFFGIAALLVSYYVRSIYQLTKVLMPRFSYLSGRGADTEIRRLFLRSTRCVMIITGALALLLWVIGPSFLRLWVKNDEITQVIPAMMILVEGNFILLTHNTSTNLLFALGQQRKVAMLAIIEGILVLGFSLALSYRYGMIGVAVGISVPFVLVRGVIQTKYACKLLKLRFWRYYAECIWGTSVITVILAGAFCWLRVGKFASNWAFLVLVSGFLVLSYGMAIYTLVLKGDERNALGEYVQKTLSRAYRVLLAGFSGR